MTTKAERIHKKRQARVRRRFRKLEVWLNGLHAKVFKRAGTTVVYHKARRLVAFHVDVPTEDEPMDFAAAVADIEAKGVKIRR